MIYLVVYHAHITYLGISTFEKILFERMRLKNDLKLKNGEITKEEHAKFG